MKQCPKCGNKYNDKMVYCVEDNNKLNDDLSRSGAETLSLPGEAGKAVENAEVQRLKQKLEAQEADIDELKRQQSETARLLSLVREYLKPRRLKVEQAQMLMEYLRSRPGGIVEIHCPPGNNEAYNLGNDIYMNLMGCPDWKFQSPQPDPNQRPHEGVIALAPTIEQGTAANILTDAFRVVGFPIASMRDESIRAGKVILFIGQKPINPLPE